MAEQKDFFAVWYRRDKKTLKREFVNKVVEAGDDKNLSMSEYRSKVRDLKAEYKANKHAMKALDKRLEKKFRNEILKAYEAKIVKA